MSRRNIKPKLTVIKSNHLHNLLFRFAGEVGLFVIRLVLGEGVRRPGRVDLEAGVDGQVGGRGGKGQRS